MLFLISSLIIAIACSVITLKTLVGYSDIKCGFKIIIGAVIILGWFAFPLIRLISKYNLISSPEAYTVVVHSLYGLMGFVFILFALIMIRDVVWYALYGAAKLMGFAGWSLDPKNLSALSKANQIVVVLSLIIAAIALHNGNKMPQVKEIYLTSDKITQDITIAQISDLHITRSSLDSRIQSIVSQVNMLNPDVIVLTGDTIDDDIPLIQKKLGLLKELSAPYGVYSIMGNHEYYHDVYAAKRMLDSLGLKFLFNGGIHVGNSHVFIAGIPDLGTMAERINLWRTVNKSEKDDYRVMLSHTPDIINSLSSGLFDLVLAGHTHGGQIFPFHLLALQATPYLAGQYSVNGTELYVSRGAGSWGPQMRLFAPTDITLIHLNKK